MRGSRRLRRCGYPSPYPSPREGGGGPRSGERIPPPLRHRRRTRPHRPQRARPAARDLARLPGRHRPLGAAQAADRRAARRRLGAARQDRGGRDGRLQGRRCRAGLARARPRPTSRCLPGSTAAHRSPMSPSAPVFRPLMLSHPLEDTDWAALDFAQFSAEWKWDGIRVQIVAGNGEAQLYSRTGDAVSQAFPDVVAGFNFDAVLDGELLVLRKGEPPPFNVAPFNDLQQRLNRKAVSKKQLEQFPGAHPPLRRAGHRRRGPARAALRRAPRPPRSLARQGAPAAHRPLAADRGRRQGGAAEAVGRHARHRHRGHHAQAPRQPLRRRPPEGPVVQVEARAAHPRLRADVCPARLRQALVLLLRLHLRHLARRRRAAQPSWSPSARPTSASPTRSCWRSTAGSATTPPKASARCARSSRAWCSRSPSTPCRNRRATSRASPCASRASTASAGTSRPPKPTGSTRWWR